MHSLQVITLSFKVTANIELFYSFIFYISGIMQFLFVSSFFHLILCLWAPLVAQMVKIPPAIQETWVHSLGQEDPLEKGMATHSSIPAWRIPWTENPSGL